MPKASQRRYPISRSSFESSNHRIHRLRNAASSIRSSKSMTIRKNDPREASSMPGVVVKAKTLPRPANLIPKIDPSHEDRQGLSGGVYRRTGILGIRRAFLKDPWKKVQKVRSRCRGRSLQPKGFGQKGSEKSRERDPAYPERDTCHGTDAGIERGMGKAQGLSKARSPAGSMPSHLSAGNAGLGRYRARPPDKIEYRHIDPIRGSIFALFEYRGYSSARPSDGLGR